jgi:hypothetical protein
LESLRSNVSIAHILLASLEVSAAYHLLGVVQLQAREEGSVVQLPAMHAAHLAGLLSPRTRQPRSLLSLGCLCVHRSMSCKAAAYHSIASPSTNVSMHCDKVGWKYHVPSHWDGCREVPDNYNLDEGHWVLCISTRTVQGCDEEAHGYSHTAAAAAEGLAGAAANSHRLTGSNSSSTGFAMNQTLSMCCCRYKAS